MLIMMMMMKKEKMLLKMVVKMGLENRTLPQPVISASLGPWTGWCLGGPPVPDATRPGPTRSQTEPALAIALPATGRRTGGTPWACRVYDRPSQLTWLLRCSFTTSAVAACAIVIIIVTIAIVAFPVHTTARRGTYLRCFNGRGCRIQE